MERSTLSDFAATEPDPDGEETAGEADADTVETDLDADEDPTETTAAEDESEGPTDDETGPAITFAVGRDRACARCGCETTRRWRTETGFVCPDCIEW